MDLESKLVSIIMPTYNSSRYVAIALESILSQTYPFFELLITDDCSTDETIDILEVYANRDKRIKIFQLEKNSGAGEARNNSIRHATGRYIAFCDSDDLWKPNKLSEQIDFMRKNSYDFVFCQSEIIDEEGKIIGINKRISRVSFHMTIFINYIGTSGVLYDSHKIGMFFMQDIRCRQDWVLWLDILKKTHYAYCYNGVLNSWRKSKSSLSSNKSILFKMHLDIYRNYFKLPLLLSYVVFFCISLPLILLKKIAIFIRSNHL